MPRTKKDIKRARHEYLVSLEKANQEKLANRESLRAARNDPPKDVKMKERRDKETRREKIARKNRETRERKAPKNVASSDVVMKVKKMAISKK